MKETDINKWATLMIERIQSLSGKDGWKSPGLLKVRCNGRKPERTRI